MVEREALGKRIVQQFHLRKAETLSDGVPFDQLSLYENISAHLRLAGSVAIDYLDRYSNILTEKLKKTSGFFDAMTTRYEYAISLAKIENASRWVNKVRRDIKTHDGSIGKMRANWHENTHHPHGKKHERIMKKGIKRLALQMNHEFMTDFQLPHREKGNPVQRIDQMKRLAMHSLLRFGETHDEGQLHVEIYNDLIPDKKNHLRPKDLHEQFGGLLALLDESKYFQKGRYTEEETKLITNMLLFTILDHGDPKTYLDKKGLQTQKAYIDTSDGPKEIEDGALFDLVKAGTLDLTSISRSQFIKIVEYKVKVGKADGTFKGFDTSTGLHPLLHKFFTKNGKINKLRRDHTPMFHNISEEEKKFLMLMRKMQLVVDLSEMVIPPIEAFARKVIVKKSEKRKAFVALNPEGNPFNPQTYVSELLKTKGDVCVSDHERTAFELFEYLHTVKDCGLLDDPSTKDIFTELLMDAFCGANWIFKESMDPNPETVEKNIRTMFNVQLFELIAKALKRNNALHLLNWDAAVKNGWLEESSNDLLKRYSLHVSDKDRHTLESRARGLSDLQSKTVKSVMSKWHMSTHDDVEQESFNKITEALAEVYAADLGIPVSILQQRMNDWDKGSLLENTRRSRLPWVSSGTFMGRPEQAKLL